MTGSGEPTRLSANINDSIHRSTLTAFLDRFVNNDDDGDSPIFEGSLKDSSSHHVRGTGLLRLGWQGSCRSFASLDCSDDSTGSVFYGCDKTDQIRGTGQAPKSLLDCFVKTSTDLTVFSENDDESENQEIKEVDKTKADLDLLPPVPTESVGRIVIQHVSKESSKINEEIAKADCCANNSAQCSVTKDCPVQSNHQKLTCTNDLPKLNIKVFHKQGRSGFTRARSRSKIISRAKNFKTSTFVYEPLSGKSLVTDNMESCSSLSFCSLNDDDLMGSSTRMVQNFLDSYHSPTKDQKDPGRSLKTRSLLRDTSKDTIPRVPSRSHSPTRE